MEDISWERYGSVGAYVVWCDGEVFSITDGGEPLSGGGYFNLESLLKLKGLRMDDVVLERKVPATAPRF
ncbi:hypothetical protein HFO56_02740 [Rhizobium laguerreae]|uniref:hypothetical protein n=1 Tax=Rhizobium laguerreae TaxID=1076926 RepID=UPI001C91D52C|nr:hypothetical protein [Rhizobium laguerreae]MBY3151303.1 hypothetical protein [Rhizobium laguerreae]